MKRIKTIVFLIFITTILCAQYPTKDIPLSFKKNSKIQNRLKKNENIEIPLIVLPAVDQAKIDATLENNNSNEIGARYRIGLPIDIDIDVKTSSKIDTLDEGMLYRLSLKSNGAKALKISFYKYDLPTGAKLFIYNKNKKLVKGPYMKKGLNSVKFNSTEIIQGDEVTLEYFEPHNSTQKGTLQIIRIMHGIVGVEDNYLSKLASFGDAGNCQVDINCPEGTNWQDEQKGVCKIVTWSYYGGTGSLINNTNFDGKPYILTNKHVFEVETPDFNREVLYSTIYFNVNSTSCNSGEVDTSIIYEYNGADYYYFDSNTDLLILELDKKPPSIPEINYHPYYNGWDRATTQEKGGVCIHHPKGDVKKIATHNIIPDPSWDGTIIFNGTVMDSTYIWKIDYWLATESGYSVTEDGSSGASLFNNNHNIIGSLMGSEGIDCVDPSTEKAYFGKSLSSWERGYEFNWYQTGGYLPSSLKSLLDPIDLNVTRLFGSQYPTESELQIRGVSEPSSIELYTSKDNIYSDSIIKADATVTYVASDEVTLEDGFHSERNSILDIFISPINNLPKCETIIANYENYVNYGQPLYYDIPRDDVNLCEVSVSKDTILYNGSHSWVEKYYASVDFSNDISDTHCAWDSVTLDPTDSYVVRVYFYGDCSEVYYEYPFAVL